MRRTTLWLAGCTGVLIGLGLARVQTAPGLAAVAPSLAMIVLTWRRRNLLTLLGILVLGLSLGWWRGSVYGQALSGYQALYGQKVSLQAIAAGDAVYGKHKQLSFDAKQVRVEGDYILTGKLQVSGFGANAVFEGDEVAVTGKLYPGFSAYQGRISFATLTVLAYHNSLSSEIRRRFAAGLQTALPEPLAPMALGLLVGQRTTIPDEVKQDLLMVGLTHIIAVSGYNLTIILNASKKLLAGYSKRLSVGLSLSLIGTFLLLTGASASIVRAAIVSLLSIAAGYYGRTFRPLLLIALAAAVTAWANPVYIWSDLSWYLSFLAFCGVLILAPLIELRFGFFDNLLAKVALESICAEIMSLPFVLHIFGQMSLIGLPANVVVVTLIPLAMLLSLIAGLAGMLAASIAGWFAWPAALILNYMLDSVHLMAHIPHIFIQNRYLSTAGMLTLYGTTTLLITMLWHKTKSRKSDIITDIN